MNTQHAGVKAFPASQPMRLFIGGEWVDAENGKTIETLDPGSGAVIAHLAAGEAADIGRAVAAADEAFRKSGWASLPANDRAVILRWSYPAMWPQCSARVRRAQTG